VFDGISVVCWIELKQPRQRTDTSCRLLISLETDWVIKFMTSDHLLLCASIFIIYNCPSHIWYCEANKYFIIPRQNCITYIFFFVNEFDPRKYSLCVILATLYVSRVLKIFMFAPCISSIKNTFYYSN
jgi:hypothetical protein